MRGYAQPPMSSDRAKANWRKAKVKIAATRAFTAPTRSSPDASPGRSLVKEMLHRHEKILKARSTYLVGHAKVYLAENQASQTLLDARNHALDKRIK